MLSSVSLKGADMAALRTSPIFVRTRRPAPTPRFEIGDRVHLVPEETEGLVVGVRYGAPAYDVKVNGTCLRNVSPDRIRLADAATPGSIVPLRRLSTMEMPDLFC
jgi:hypothetical protein